MRTFSIVATIVLGFMAALTLSAQEQPSTSNIASTVVVGTRVRVTSPAIEKRSWTHWRRLGVPGVVTMIDDSSMTLAGEQSVMKVPLSSITKLETSRGKKRNTVVGLVLGLCGGFAAALMYSMANPDFSCVYNDDSCVNYTGISLLAGGGAIGTAIGALTKSERWRKVSLNTSPAAPGKDLGPAVALAVRF